MYNCPLCQRDYEEESKFHRHIAPVHKQILEDYYQTAFPRFDLLTGELIPFKNREQYTTASFTDRNNFIQYCIKQPIKARAAILKVIELRSKSKNINRLLSTIEARSTIYPTPLLCKSLKIDWMKLGEELNLSCNYNYNQLLTFASDANFNILIDKREQLPLNFKYKTLSTTLNFGDYTSSSNFNNTFIERKSINDLIGTLSKGYERFGRELERAKEFNANIVVLVENDITEILSGNYKKLNKQIKATPDFILHRMREIMNNYITVQFLFTKNRDEAARTLPRILLCKNKKVDWQWAYDGGALSI